MKIFPKLVSSMLVLTMLVSSSITTYALPKVKEELKKQNWSDRNYNALNQLIKKHSINNDNYDIKVKPYAVFDFDNTTAMNDVAEALFIYQLENLKFKIPTDKMKEVLKTNIPTENFGESWNNLDGSAVNIELISIDITSSYSWLYANYKGFDGKKSLEEIKKTIQYQDFVTKMRYLYDAIGDTFSPDISYPWITYLFYGMTSEEVQTLTKQSNEYWFKYNKYEKIKWTSPSELKGVAGVVSVSYKSGLRIFPEMIDLYNTLMNNGIEVYVCSASFYDIILATATDPNIGLNVKPINVFAMRLKKDENKKFINEFDNYYFQTQGEGKTKTIDAFIKPNHNMNDPILVAGDSDGDYFMMKDYKNMEFGLIINRVKGGNIGILSKLANDTINGKSIYYLQGRDENKGQLRKSEKTILLGDTIEKLLK